MPEIDRLEFTHQEVAEALIRQSDIKDGLWGITIKFGLKASNIAAETEGNLVPAALVPVLNIGLQKFDTSNSLTVDASRIKRKKNFPQKIEF